MQWSENLPDVGAWQPEAGRQETLRDALMKTCQVIQKLLVARAEAEIAFNVRNYDSGLGIEEIVREELAKLLPQRYVVNAGVVNDRSGNTAGDCDMLVRDPLWSPVIKPGATIGSRRYHFPIEAVYAAAEIKQTLGFKGLDEAMEKLVKISRLERQDNPYGHITENQHLPCLDKPGFILNPLHTTVFGLKLAKGVTFDDLVKRFGEINNLLNRNHMVTMLCVLGGGTAWYSTAAGSPYDADFMRDRSEPLILQVNGAEPDNAFYRWYVLLAGHLTRSGLRLHDVFDAYGSPPPPRTVIR